MLEVHEIRDTLIEQSPNYSNRTISGSMQVGSAVQFIQSISIDRCIMNHDGGFIIGIAHVFYTSNPCLFYGHFQ